MNNAAGCPSLPEHMKVQVSPIDDLPCYSEVDQGVAENEDDLEYNREYEEVCSFRVYGSTKEVPNEIPQKLTDGCDKELEHSEREPPSSCTPSYVGMSHDMHGHNKELEDYKRVPPSCAPSYTVAGRSETEIIIEDGEEDQFEGNGVNLQQKPGRTNSMSKVGRCNIGYPPSEYEVIDVCTPSPDCRTSSNSRFKRRITSVVGSEIIDLTKSPTFIRL